MIPMAIALTIMAAAVKIFASMSWEELGRGLAGVLGTLVAIGAAVAEFPPSVLLIGPGLPSFQLPLLLIPVDLRQHELETILGILGIGGALLMMVPCCSCRRAAMTAAGLVLVAAALSELPQWWDSGQHGRRHAIGGHCCYWRCASP
jgi:hypothetical protein